MQVVVQEYETTVLEMAQKYDEEKGMLEKEKGEVNMICCAVTSNDGRFLM